MRKYLVSLAAILFMLRVIPVRAQDQAPPPPPGQQGGQGSDQPAELQPGVARVSFMHGDVSSQRGDNGDWVAATLNTPISTNDRVATGEKSRAELQLDYADVLRMSDSATAKVANLSRTHIQLQIGQGLVTYSVLKGSEADTEIDTPNASIHPQGPGEYRILVNSDAETQVVVRDGFADVSTPQGSTHVGRGQMITVEGTDSPQYRTASAPGRDDWDSWNNDRDHRINGAESWRKTNHYYTGSEDLDAYGRWRQVPDYGQVWVPAQGHGWAPYRDGRWVYEPYYGWTWVSYEPWGWAPYHYGRWFVDGDDWVWWPGPVVAYPAYYPVWSPAYVSFFGFGGGGFGFGVGFGRFGWLPVGPCDDFNPWWGRWGNRVNVINITNIHNTTIINNNRRDGFGPLAGERFRGRRFSNIDEALRNERVRGGISSMPGNEFGRGRVPAQQERISEASFRRSSLMAGKMPVAPSRESFSPSGRAADPSAFRKAPPNSQRFFTPGMRQGAASISGVGNAGKGQTTFGNNRENGMPNSQNQHGSAAPNNNARERSVFNNNGNGGTFQRPTSSVPGQIASQTPVQAMNQNRGNAPASVQSSGPGWHTFTPPQSVGGYHPPQGTGGNGGANMNNTARGTIATPSRPSSQGAPQGANPGGQGENRGSWQHFTPPAHVSQPSQPQSSGRGFVQPNQSQRPFNPPPASQGNGRTDVNNSARGTFVAPSRPPSQGAPQGANPSGQGENRGSWQHFNSPARESQPQTFNRGSAQPNESQRSFNPPSSASRGNSSNSYSRPPLDMRQPIVTPRGGGYYGNGSSSGGPRAYSAPRSGSYSAPQGGGGNSAPRGGYSAPQGGSGGASRGSGGGGNRGGNGGGRSGDSRSR